MSSHICEDGMLNIFQRLPPKSIVRFRSLSKSWFSRLASPDFIRMYNQRSLSDHTREKVLVRQRVGNGEFKDIYTLHLKDPELSLAQDYGYLSIKGIELPYHDAKIIGSCNGIICLLKSREFSLWNFSIRRKLDVPNHPYSRASMVSGFGFDPITNDYKIVCISYAHNKGTAVCKGNNSFIYSIKTDSWNVIAPPTILIFEVESNACFFNEKLHWVVSTDWTGRRIILTFSITTHVFGTIEFPKSNSRARQLTIINGSLALISWADDYTWVWLMSQSDNVASWSMLFEYKSNNFDVVRFFQPVSNGDLLIYDTRCEVYNPRTQLFTKILEFGPCHGLEINRHAESLELLDKRTTFGKTIFSSTIKKNHKKMSPPNPFNVVVDDDDDDDDDGDDDDDDDDDDDQDKEDDDDFVDVNANYAAMIQIYTDEYSVLNE